MAKIELRYVQRLRDRHGRLRHYFRRAGFKPVTLPGLPGSTEFMDAYRTALAATPKGAGKPAAPRSIEALFVAYYRSDAFTSLKPQTQRGYRHILEPFRQERGHASAATMDRIAVRALVEQKAATPAMARKFLKCLRILLDEAVEQGWRDTNPARTVKMPSNQSDGFIPWDDEHIEQFAAHWPQGSRARRALALLLYTGQRRSDVVNMGRQHVRDGCIRVTQVKRAKGAPPTSLLIPIHPELQAELDLTPAGDLAFIMTKYGQLMTPPGFTNWFVGCARDAGLPAGLAPHGLRKAAARRLAEAGCSAHQIASITGHRSLKEVEHYARSADQAKMAVDAIAAISAKQ